ncbi:hypothetical protein MCEMAEM4_03376 [Burkholderiaceae bacterium]
MTLALNTQDVDVRALGHADITVFPAGHVDVINHLGGAGPVRCPRLISSSRAVDRFLDDRIGVVELENGLVAREVQHGLTLGIRQLREVTVRVQVSVVVTRRCRRLSRQRFTCGVGPIDAAGTAVVVVNTLYQVLDKTTVYGRVRVVVTDLRQSHVHGRVLATDLEFFVFRNFRDGRFHPRNFRHLHLTHGDLLITRHRLNGLSHGAVRLDRHRART